MNIYSSRGHRNTGNSRPIRRGMGRYGSAWVFSLALCLCGSGLAATSSPGAPGRLFYTPEQRAQLEAARTRNLTQPRGQNKTATPATPAPLRFDGMLIRSDGKTTRWVDGKPQLDGAAVSGLKPGQIRADGHVYEPYQVLRSLPPTPAAPGEKESAP